MSEPSEHTDLLRRAERGYHYDPEFHAKVEMAVSVVVADLRERTGARMSSDDMSLATIAAAVALVIDDLSLYPSTATGGG